MILGHDRQVAEFRDAWNSGSLHHAWLLAGPRGVGKGSFARAISSRLLAEAAGPPVEPDWPQLPSEPDLHPIARLVDRGSHPDFRLLERELNDKGNLRRNITVDQVRELGGFFAMAPALSAWRAVVIDSIDELEPSAANALLKMLEEPPANCVFLLVSHAPGRLLPTIRSRCRRIDFQGLGDDVMAALLERLVPSLDASERRRIAAVAGGSAGLAMAFAELDLAPLEKAATAIIREGDPTNARRAELAAQLGRKGAADRYSAFLALVPSLIAREALAMSGGKQVRALEAYGLARELAAVAPRHSLDPAATMFQIGGILHSIAEPRLA